MDKRARVPGGHGRKRKARGFSESEVELAGLTPSQARGLGVRVDPRRKTSYEFNVETLKKLAEAKS